MGRVDRKRRALLPAYRLNGGERPSFRPEPSRLVCGNAVVSQALVFSRASSIRAAPIPSHRGRGGRNRRRRSPPAARTGARFRGRTLTRTPVRGATGSAPRRRRESSPPSRTAWFPRRRRSSRDDSQGGPRRRRKNVGSALKLTARRRCRSAASPASGPSRCWSRPRRLRRRGPAPAPPRTPRGRSVRRSSRR